MSFRNGLVSMLVNQKKYQAIQEYLQIEFPEEDSVMVLEYAGERPRLFKNINDDIVLMLPDEMDTYMENAVTRAIEDGTLFDDAKNVNNTAEYIRMTTLPYNGMMNKGYDEPKALKSAVGSVVGTMNADGRFGGEDSDLRNGYNLMHDMVHHANDSDDSTFKLIGDYIKLKDNGKLPIEYRRDIGKVKHDVKKVNDVDCEDCISDDDYKDLELTDECGSSVCYDEEDTLDMGDSGMDSVDTSDISSSDMDASSVDTTTECGDDEFDECFTLDDIISMTDEIIVEFDVNQAVQNGKYAVKDAGKQLAIWFKKMIAKLVYNYNKMSFKSKLSYLQKMADKINHHANYKFEICNFDPSTLKTNSASEESADIYAKMNELFGFFQTHDDSIDNIERLTGIADELIGVYKDDIMTISNIVKKSEWVEMSLDKVYDYIDRMKNMIKAFDVTIADTKHVLTIEKIISDGNITDIKNLLMKIVQFIAIEMKMLSIDIKCIRVVKNTDNDTTDTSGEEYQEGFFTKKPKKLKPIPRDIIPYITIEANNIKDANDQQMIAGYTCSKLELVDFYLNCIDTQDDRYIVPHTRQYLVQMQNDLNRLLTQILRVRPVNKMDRMWKVGVNLPG